MSCDCLASPVSDGAVIMRISEALSLTKNLLSQWRNFNNYCAKEKNKRIVATLAIVKRKEINKHLSFFVPTEIRDEENNFCKTGKNIRAC